jgi:16S rRNA processing protein RimM
MNSNVVMEKDLFPIGRVVKPHGVKGQMKVEYFGDDSAHFSQLREIFIEAESGRVRGYEILSAVPQPPGFILRLKGVDAREGIEKLIGREILVRKEALSHLEEGEYYWFDILGMEVRTEEGKRIGRVKEIFPTGANDVYIIEGERREIDLPATEEVIRHIDIEKRVMTVRRIEGLWEDEDEV